MKPVAFLALICMLFVSCNVSNGSKDASRSIAESNQDLQGKEFELVTLENGEPSHITVQHILISFGSLLGKPIRRSMEEARQLAIDIQQKAAEGEDFDALVKAWTDDAHPGIYKIANINQPTDMSSKDRSQWTRPRTSLVGAFGDVGFKLEVGEVGVAEFHPSSSPYGWHVIKRIK